MGFLKFKMNMFILHKSFILCVLLENILCVFVCRLLSSFLHLLFDVTQLPGKKDLFIEADLMSPLDRIANVSTLRVKASNTPLPFIFEEEKLQHLQLLQTFYLYILFAATWSGQTLQSGIQTYYEHFRSVSAALFSLCTFHTHTHTPDGTVWQCDVFYRICFLIRPRIQTVKWICGK